MQINIFTGGVCEIRTKDKIQMFNPFQKVIVSVSFVLVSYASFAYMYNLEHKTLFGQVVADSLMSQEEINARAQAEYDKEAAEFDSDDDF